MKSCKHNKKLISFVIACTIIFASMFTASCNRIHFDDFPAIWSCDDGDIKISIMTTGDPSDRVMGTLTLDGEEFEILLSLTISRSAADIYKVADIEEFIGGNVIRGGYETFIVSCEGYKKSVTFTIKKDNTNRDGRESLVGRKLVLERHDLY